jgi:hypothetical protein
MHTTVIGSNKSTLTVHNRATERARREENASDADLPEDI